MSQGMQETSKAVEKATKQILPQNFQKECSSVTQILDF